MKTRKVERRWKSAIAELMEATAFKRPARMSRTEEWVLRQMVYACQSGDLTMHYSDGYLFLSNNTRQRRLGSVLRSAPKPPKDAPIARVVVHAKDQEQYDTYKQQIEEMS